MAKPLEGGIARLVYKALKQAKLSKPATLIKSTPGARTGGAVTGGLHPSTTSYACRGFVEDYAPGLIDGTLITAQDRRVSLIGASIASSQIPAPNDRVTIEGATYTIQRVRRDPAAAIYDCQARGASS